MEHTTISLRRHHLTRLMSIWRSAGWRCNDAIELDLVAAGWASLSASTDGHEAIRLTDAGVRLLAESRQRNLRSLSAHDRLAQRVAGHLASTGRIVWRELALRTRVDGQDALAAAEEPAQGLWPQDPSGEVHSRPRSNGLWRVARPDVFSVRHTSVENYLQPMVHEVKVSRADLLSDLRHGAKRESYRWLSCETYYVFPVGVAEPAEIPQEFGVWVMHGSIDSGSLELARPAMNVPCSLPFAVWMALARATPVRMEVEATQRELGGAVVDRAFPTSSVGPDKSTASSTPA